MDCVPPFSLTSMLLAAIVAGIAWSAVDAAVEQAGRVWMASGTSWAEWPMVQNTVAAPNIATETTRAGLSDVAEECWREVECGALQQRTHARLHAIADHALRIGRQVVSDLFTVGSVDGLRTGHELEEALRDLHGMSVQRERYRNFQLDAGQVLLAGEPRDPRF